MYTEETRGILAKYLKELLRSYGVNDEKFLGTASNEQNYINILRDRKVLLDEAFFKHLAKDLNLEYIEPKALRNKSNLALGLPFNVIKKNLIFILSVNSKQVKIATANPFNFKLFKELGKIFKRDIEICVATIDAIEEALDYGYREIHTYKALGELRDRAPEESAFTVLYKWQKIFIICCAIFLIICLILAPTGTTFILFLAVNLLYFFLNPFKLYISLRGFENSGKGITVTEAEVRNLNEDNLPIYTVLIPVYKEAEVLSDIIINMNRMDYPKDKLDIKVLVEEKDDITLNEAKRLGLIGGRPEVMLGNMTAEEYQEYTKIFEILIVPDADIKTKPRACNYGLYRARGEYVCIYDAEDEPDIDQLKKAIIAFSKVDDSYICLQGHLNFYNPKENLLARWFSLEYSFWFDYWLQGLDFVDAPLPLGGTSNHFKTKIIKQLGGWDPYNVTEDADLGIRISIRNYNTAMLNSYTLEEANLEVWNWIRQRSRWFKGYMQTFLVHMRFPLKFIRGLGWKKFAFFMFTFGGNILLPLINPLLWIVTILTLFFPAASDYLFPPELQTICEFNLILGNLIYIVLHIGPYLLKRNYGSIPVALTIPIYWIMISIGAWKGFAQLITKPFYWEKTTHGLSSFSKKSAFVSVQQQNA
jgi:cellulose synthase/poly-beta-1,6-N-acetylglucosamine synthase-like glycosyltransferase